MAIPDREGITSDMIKCNALSIPMMCSIILPQMYERKRGLIINISSLSAIVPAGCITPYAATKAFAHKFSEDLAMEYKKDGIIIQSVVPGPVATNMTRLKKGSWMAPMANVFVESALKTVGIAPYTTGYYPHAILQIAAQWSKFLVPNVMTNMTVKTMLNVRNKAIKKGVYSSANQ